MTDYQIPMFTRLLPRTVWKGGRLSDTDMVTLDDAARFACLHASAVIAPGDFLRAAARGEILLRAVCPRTVTMLPCRPADQPLTMPESSLPTLPLDACKALANVGWAAWRNIDGFEDMSDDLHCRYVRWQLPDGEPDLETLTSECRVSGHDVHALADQYLCTLSDAAPVLTVQGPWATSASVQNWKLKRPSRFQGYGKPLYDLLRAAHISGGSVPKARDVLDAWKVSRPPVVFEVADDGLKYEDSNGNAKEANLDAIRQAINRMIE